MPYRKYTDEPTSEEILQSKFDSGMFKILRLNRGWDNCHKYYRNADLRNLNKELNLIWRELKTDAEKNESGKVERINMKLRLIKKNVKSPLTRKGMLARALEKKWDILYAIEKKQGLGKRYINPDEDELD
jgi:hypothetical protein